MVNRSALALKLLVSSEHGSIVAAATFGLPEELGGERNWDYRYTWIRDASFTLYALIRLGYTTEAGRLHGAGSRTGAWSSTRTGRCRSCTGIDGRKILAEEMLDHLEGYEGSSPVRIGNGAYEQLQLDIYGELMDSVYLYNKYGEPISHDMWRNLVRLVDWVTEHWQLPDEGIWEVRGGRQEFLYSRLHVLGRRRPWHPPRRPPLVPVPLRPLARRRATRSTTTSTRTSGTRTGRRSCSTSARPRSTQRRSSCRW